MKASLFLLLSSVFLLSGCFKTRAEIAREKEEKEMRASLNQTVSENNQNLERLQSEIGRLQGKIEELEHQRKKEQGASNAAVEGNEKSVTALKSQLEETQKNQALLFEEIKRLREENLQLVKNMDRPAPSHSGGAGGGQKKNQGGSGGNSFESALTAYKAKDYEAATDGFRAFLDSNPKSKKALDARFYVGDSLYRRKEYAEAIQEFSVVYEKAPGTPLGRKSTLRIAESFRGMGKIKDAKAFAQIVMQSNPSPEEAKRARNILK